MIRRSLSVVVPLLFAAGIVMAVEWSDVEGRIQYAWYTEDTRALRGVLASLEGGVSDDPLQAYYLGFGQYRLALLGLGRAREAAAKAAENCVDHLAAANEARRDFADALALQAACQGLVASLKAWKAPLLAPRSASQLERALQLEPRNPRVLLLAALADGDSERAYGSLRKAVAAFEEERRGTASLPAWGAPEAYLQLARRQLERGDSTVARSTLERALLLAPDFGQAKRFMATITAG